jgi:Domain of unknown function (DUF4260)
MSFANGSVRTWLRSEGLVAFLASVLLYRAMSASWVVFAALFLAPDLSMLGYLGGSRVGAAVYNAAHNYALPLLLLMAAIFTPHHRAAPYALIWMAHIGFDRMLGYGLKYPSAFADTHLGRTGRRRQRAAELA